MGKTILCESAGWVLFSDGARLVFADRRTSYRHVLVFVLALIVVIAGSNGIWWLVVGLRAGTAHQLGIVLILVAGLSGFAASRIWSAVKQERTEIPARDAWVAVIDLEARTLEAAGGEVLAPLSSVRFVPVWQLSSSSRALAAKWPDGSRVVYRGSPFAGGFQAARDALRRHGADT